MQRRMVAADEAHSRADRVVVRASRHVEDRVIAAAGDDLDARVLRLHHLDVEVLASAGHDCADLLAHILKLVDHTVAVRADGAPGLAGLALALDYLCLDNEGVVLRTRQKLVARTFLAKEQALAKAQVGDAGRQPLGHHHVNGGAVATRNDEVITQTVLGFDEICHADELGHFLCIRLHEAQAVEVGADAGKFDVGELHAELCRRKKLVCVDKTLAQVAEVVHEHHLVHAPSLTSRGVERADRRLLAVEAQVTAGNNARRIAWGRRPDEPFLDIEVLDAQEVVDATVCDGGHAACDHRAGDVRITADVLAHTHDAQPVFCTKRDNGADVVLDLLGVDEEFGVHVAPALSAVRATG